MSLLFFRQLFPQIVFLNAAAVSQLDMRVLEMCCSIVKNTIELPRYIDFSYVFLFLLQIRIIEQNILGPLTFLDLTERSIKVRGGAIAF